MIKEIIYYPETWIGFGLIVLVITVVLTIFFINKK